MTPEASSSRRDLARRTFATVDGSRASSDEVGNLRANPVDAERGIEVDAEVAAADLAGRAQAGAVHAEVVGGDAVDFEVECERELHGSTRSACGVW